VNAAWASIRSRAVCSACWWAWRDWRATEGLRLAVAGADSGPDPAVAVVQVRLRPPSASRISPVR
jgi:hypothetical protein